MTTGCAATPARRATTRSPTRPTWSPRAATSTSFTGAQPANANSNGDPADQYVAKHFPTGWFTSLTGESAGTQSGVTYPAQPALNEPTTPEYDGPGAPTTGATDTNCDANHVANLDDPTYGLAHDLSLPANEVPAFNWITPNNCSDAHDATCQGNNLSGAFNANGTPNYTPAGLPAYDPEATTPTNYTGGLYASDLFLRYYIPLIEQSAAFKDGGLDRHHLRRGQPAVHDRQQLQQRPGPRRQHDLLRPGRPADLRRGRDARTRVPTRSTAPTALLADAAGENINGHNVSTEPTGPNDPEVTNSSGNQLQPGPGAAGFIDRPTGLAGESPNVSGSPGAATEPALVAAGLEHGHRLEDQRRRHRPPRLGHRRHRQHDPARHLRRGGQRHRADRAVGQRQHQRRRRTTSPSRGSGPSSCSTTAGSRSRCRTGSTATSP